MKALVVEDEFVSRMALQEMLLPYGTVHAAVNGAEAVTAVRHAIETGAPYDFISLDALMPVMSGGQALTSIRELEQVRGISGTAAAKVVVTTAIDAADGDIGSVARHLLQDMKTRCDGHLAKPVKKSLLIRLLRSLDLIS